VRAALPSTAGVAVVALGSYARSELCPASDVDLLLLHAGSRQSDLEELVRAICYPLWDRGLSIGYAVRTPREAVRAAQQHVQSGTALTDRRLVVGDTGLMDDLTARYGRWLRRHGRSLLSHLEAADNERRAKAGPHAGFLEPDLKRGAGGLRDVQSLRWAAACLLGSHGLEPLVGARYLGAGDLPALRSAARTLLSVRCALHLQLGRFRPGAAADRLTLEIQDAVAERMGIGDGDDLLRIAALASRRIAHVHSRAWPQMIADAKGGRGRKRPAPQPLDDGVRLVDGVVEIEPDRRLADDSTLGLRALAAAAAQGAHLGRGSATRLSRELGELRTLRWSPESRSALLAILRRGAAAVPALADADEVGLLAALLPDWVRVRGTPQRNPYHTYDLDTHLVQSLAELGDLAAGVHDPRHATIWEGLDEPDVVLLGTWLHDVGKAYDGDHAVVGAVVARDWMLRMGFDGRRADRVAKLVRLHLLLPQIATSRDLDDEDELARVAEQVGDVETLDGLYLLCLADSRATGPATASPWRASLVTELHARVRTRLSSDPSEIPALTGPQAVLARARELADGAEVDRTVAGVPRRYLLAASAEQVVAHARLLAERGGGAKATAAFRDGDAEGTRVLSAVAVDRVGLMADIAGVLAGYGLVVLEARAFTRGDGTALDWFVVTGDARAGDDEIVADVAEAAAGRCDVARLVASREASYDVKPPGLARPVPIEVTFDRGPVLTRIEVRGPDAPGVLYRLGRVLAEARLDVVGARVATLGPEVLDVFFVRPSGGPPDTVALEEQLRTAAGWPGTPRRLPSVTPPATPPTTGHHLPSSP
jgi:[protein-PII] uridylyltransferase